MWARTLISESGRDPPSINNKCCSIDFNCVFLLESCLHTQLAAFVAEERINNVKAVLFLAVDDFFTGDEHFFTRVELADHIIRFEHVVNGPFLFGHSPPSEVHLSPGRAIHHR